MDMKPCDILFYINSTEGQKCYNELVTAMNSEMTIILLVLLFLFVFCLGFFTYMAIYYNLKCKKYCNFIRDEKLQKKYKEYHDCEKILVG